MQILSNTAQRVQKSNFKLRIPLKAQLAGQRFDSVRFGQSAPTSQSEVERIQAVLSQTFTQPSPAPKAAASPQGQPSQLSIDWLSAPSAEVPPSEVITGQEVLNVLWAIQQDITDIGAERKIETKDFGVPLNLLYRAFGSTKKDTHKNIADAMEALEQQGLIQKSRFGYRLTPLAQELIQQKIIAVPADARSYIEQRKQLIVEGKVQVLLKRDFTGPEYISRPSVTEPSKVPGPVTGQTVFNIAYALRFKAQTGDESSQQSDLVHRLAPFLPTKTHFSGFTAEEILAHIRPVDREAAQDALLELRIANLLEMDSEGHMRLTDFAYKQIQLGNIQVPKGAPADFLTQLDRLMVR